MLPYRYSMDISVTITIMEAWSTAAIQFAVTMAAQGHMRQIVTNVICILSKSISIARVLAVIMDMIVCNRTR